MGHEHEHGAPHAVDVEFEATGGLRRLGLVLLVFGALLLSAGAWFLLRAGRSGEELELARALELRAAGQLEASEALLVEATARHPGSAALLGELGWVRLLRGDAGGALEPLQAAALADPSSPTVPVDLAVVYLALERGREAESSARRGIELDRGNAAAWLYLARALVTQGRVQEALPAVSMAVELAPADPGFVSELAQACLVAGEPARARAQFERLCELLPERWEPQVDLAQLCLDLGDREAARAALARALELAPGEPAVVALEGELASDG